MAGLTFHQELVKSGVSALAVALAGGVSVALGWSVVRWQERIKRQEEHAASLRKLRADALVKALEALGRYHNLKDRRLLWEADTQVDRAIVKAMKDEEGSAAEQLVNTVAHQQFLLGPLADALSRTWQEMARATTNAQLGAAIAPLHAELEKWIPPLEPIPFRRSWKIWPWIAICSMLAVSAPLLHPAIGGKVGVISGEGAAIGAILVGFYALRRALRALHAGGRVKIGTDRTASAGS